MVTATIVAACHHARVIRSGDLALRTFGASPDEEHAAGDACGAAIPARLLLCFAALVLFFATAGNYGTMNRRVALNRHEIGMRMVLGALESWPA